MEGINTANLNGIIRTLEGGGEARDPVRAARVGSNLYLVDGFHRREAYKQCGRQTIPAKVAKMSLTEARDYARASNGMNGKPYSRADKERAFSTYIAEGRHRDGFGVTKSSRAIAAELGGGVYSHETIRKKLKDAGIEIDEEVEYDGDYKPRGSEEELEADLSPKASSWSTHCLPLVTWRPPERGW